ncbi:MAG: DinB family protein [Phycisphaerae bacterium]|nr:DinB family protein [Phycisphaerae bacterium]
MTERQRALSVLELSRSQLTKLLDGFPPDQALYQPTPAVNHTLWIIGHLATLDNIVLRRIDDGQPALPEKYEQLFNFGTQMQSADAYPPFGEVLGHLREVREHLIAATHAASDARMAETVPDFGCDVLGMVFLTAWHEGWHSGQLSTIRRSLKLPSIYAPE